MAAAWATAFASAARRSGAAGPKALAEHSVGTMEAQRARLAQRGSMHSTAARQAIGVGAQTAEVPESRSSDVVWGTDTPSKVK